MIEWIIEWIERFLNQFIGTPKHDMLYSLNNAQDNSFLAHAIRCESTHFLSSCAMGYFLFVLTWIILSSSKQDYSDHYIFRFSFVCGLLASVTCHIFIDGFTSIA
jgi:hypothetical protein